jgi:hypothetical protein
MSGGDISSNTASRDGGGVYNSGTTFSMSGGTISNNKATNNGGGVYNIDSTGPRRYYWEDEQHFDGVFSLSKKGVISSNKAEVGGDIYDAGTFNRRNGVISDNTADQYNDIYLDNDSKTNDNNIADYVVFIVSIVIIVSVIVGGLVFYSKKKKNCNRT